MKELRTVIPSISPINRPRIFPLGRVVKLPVLFCVLATSIPPSATKQLLLKLFSVILSTYDDVQNSVE